MFPQLVTAYCYLFGSNSTLVAFVAGAAVLVFFVVLALNEGNQMMTWAIKILIGVSGLVGSMAIVKNVFNVGITCGVF